MALTQFNTIMCGYRYKSAVATQVKGGVAKAIMLLGQQLQGVRDKSVKRIEVPDVASILSKAESAAVGNNKGAAYIKRLLVNVESLAKSVASVGFHFIEIVICVALVLCSSHSHGPEYITCPQQNPMFIDIASKTRIMRIVAESRK
jgi:hypothetical protein